MHASPETEALILGAILNAENADTTAERLIADHGVSADLFSDTTHSLFFGAAMALVSRRSGVDAGTVWTVAQKLGPPNGSLERLEAIRFLDTPKREDIALHVGLLKRLAKLRALEAFAESLLSSSVDKSADPAALGERLAAFSRGFDGSSDDFYTGERDIEQIMEEWDASMRGDRLGVLPTGVAALDDVIGGYPENLTVVAGASSGGKSALVGTSILNAMVAGHRVAVFGLEDGTVEMQRRFLALRTGLALKDIGQRRLSAYEQEKISQEGQRLWDMTKRNLLSYNPTNGEKMKSSHLIQMCRKAIGTGVRAIFIDHGLEVEHEAAVKGEEMRHRIARTFSSLRNLAFNAHIPIVVVLHLNRNGSKSDGAPRQEDLAESADVERLSRLILGVWNLQGDNPEDVRVSVMKQTRGRRNVHLMLKRELEQAMVKSTVGEEFEWPPKRKASEKGSSAWGD